LENYFQFHGKKIISIAGGDYLAVLRAFRNEMNERKAYWDGNFLGKTLVLCSTPGMDANNVSLSE